MIVPEEILIFWLFFEDSWRKNVQNRGQWLEIGTGVEVKAGGLVVWHPIGGIVRPIGCPAL
jgi:hypothetical protein